MMKIMRCDLEKYALVLLRFRTKGIKHAIKLNSLLIEARRTDYK